MTRFLAVLTAIVALVYTYVAWRLAIPGWARVALALPFVMVWLVPVIYWSGVRDGAHALDDALHAASYLCMGWLNFLVLGVLLRDGLLLASRLAGLDAVHAAIADQGSPVVLAASVLAVGAGALLALRGPRHRRVVVPIEGLDPAFDGFRIVQISDLHVGPTVGRRYVRRVVSQCNALGADLVVLTGDIVDGPVDRLTPRVAPLADLVAAEGVVFVLGNHDCYSGARPWIAHFRSLGMTVLLNDHRIIERAGARMIVGGVVDPALRATEPQMIPRADRAAAPHLGRALRILLAHNPALAPQGAAAGFDLQLSGHTHAGQFFPWTLAVRMVHGPLVWGLSRVGSMWVYVSAGTGTWGPPVRLGTEPELTSVQLVRPAPAGRI